MPNNRVEVKEFIKFVPRMRVFQLSMAAVLIGLTVSAWFLVKVMEVSAGGLLFSMIFALVIAIPPLLYLCYQIYTGKLPQPQTVDSKVHMPAAVIRELISTIPLLLCGIAGLYFLLNYQLRYGTAFFVAGLGLWALLRYLVSKTGHS